MNKIEIELQLDNYHLYWEGEDGLFFCDKDLYRYLPRPCRRGACINLIIADYMLPGDPVHSAVIHSYLDYSSVVINSSMHTLPNTVEIRDFVRRLKQEIGGTVWFRIDIL